MRCCSLAERAKKVGAASGLRLRDAVERCVRTFQKNVPGIGGRRSAGSHLHTCGTAEIERWTFSHARRLEDVTAAAQEGDGSFTTAACLTRREPCRRVVAVWPWDARPVFSNPATMARQQGAQGEAGSAMCHIANTR